MPTPTFQPPQGQLDTAQLQDWIVKLIRDLNFMLGNLDTLNVNRLDAKVVTTGTLNAALVTIKAALTGLAYIQLSAAGMVINDGTKNTFTADINGLLTMVGALIQSASGFPRVELNSVNALLAAYTTALNYIQIVADNGGQPALFFNNGSLVTGIISPISGANNTLSILTTNGKGNINIDSGQDLNLSAAAGKKIKLSSWDNTLNNLTTRTLQQDLDAKANAFSGVSGTVYVSSTSGGPVTTPITFSNGIRTS